MSQSIKISDLTSKLIRLKGLRIDKDIPLVFTGTRFSEKLTASLVASEEEVVLTPLIPFYIPSHEPEYGE
jgi:FlaA1/EpsC-like NDP-sugar epimerase